MDYEQLNDKLCEKVTVEMESYRNWMLQQSREEILEHTFEYSTKMDICISLMETDQEDLSEIQLATLLASPCPLADIYKEYCNSERNHLDPFRECAGELADRLIQNQREQAIKKVAQAAAEKQP